MTLLRICADNYDPIRFSLKQPGRMHVYDGKTVCAIRKVGRHFRLQVHGKGEWITAIPDANLTVLPLPEAWRTTDAGA